MTLLNSDRNPIKGIMPALRAPRKAGSSRGTTWCAEISSVSSASTMSSRSLVTGRISDHAAHHPFALDIDVAKLIWPGELLARTGGWPPRSTPQP